MSTIQRLCIMKSLLLVLNLICSKHEPRPASAPEPPVQYPARMRNDAVVAPLSYPASRPSMAPTQLTMPSMSYDYPMATAAAVGLARAPTMQEYPYNREPVMYPRGSMYPGSSSMPAPDYPIAAPHAAHQATPSADYPMALSANRLCSTMRSVLNSRPWPLQP